MSSLLAPSASIFMAASSSCEMSKSYFAGLRCNYGSAARRRANVPPACALLRMRVAAHTKRVGLARLVVDCVCVRRPRCVHEKKGKMGSGGSRVSEERFNGELSKTLVGHQDTVTCCAFSPDGRMLATSSADHTVLVWDTKTFRPRAHLKGHTDGVTAVSFSHDSTFLVSSGRDTRVILWDPRVGKLLQKARKHKAAVLHCSFSPDDPLVFATASEDQTAGLWRVQGPRMERKELLGHKGPVFQANFSPDKVLLATCANDKKIILWNRSSAKRVNRLKDPYSRVLSCQFSPDGTLIAAIVDGEKVRIWNTLRGEVVNVLEGHHVEPIVCCAFSPDGRVLVTGAGDKTYALWSVEETHSLPTYHSKAHDSWVQCVAFSPDMKLLATASSDKLVHLWK